MPPSNTKAVTSNFVKIAAFYKIFYGFQKELIMLIKIILWNKKAYFFRISGNTLSIIFTDHLQWLCSWHRL